jgi:hypothetical protein
MQDNAYDHFFSFSKIECTFLKLTRISAPPWPIHQACAIDSSQFHFIFLVDTCVSCKILLHLCSFNIFWAKTFHKSHLQSLANFQ